MKPRTFLVGVVLGTLTFTSTIAAGDQKKEDKKPLAGYSSIVVGKFDVDRNPATEDFPKGLETIMQSRAVKDIRENKVFPEVVDGSETPSSTTAGQEKPLSPADPAKSGPAPSSQQIVLSATVLTYDKGNRAARYMVGFGAGESRVKMRFVFRDAGSGAEVLRFDQQGTFKGTLSVFGGSGDEAYIKAARSVVNNLVKELQKNR